MTATQARFDGQHEPAQMPEPLGTLVASGRPAVIPGRWSSQGGRKAFEAAVGDLMGAVDAFHAQTGWDVRPALPDEEELRHRLEHTPTVASTRSAGRPLRHRFCEVDLRPAATVIVVLITGSGEKLDVDGRQPVVIHLAQLVRRHRAAVLFAKRSDRLARQAWGFAPLAHALEEQGTLLGDERTEPRSFDDVASLLAFLQGREGSKEAHTLTRKTRQGQARKTERAMVDGQVPYRLGGTVPPGFATAHLDDGSGGRGNRVLFLDTPAHRPAEHEVTFGLSQVRHSDGSPVDQVANVQWLLARIGHPAWPYKRLLAELATRRYSTEKLRGGHRQADAAYDGGLERGRALLESVLTNLEVYETGVLSRRLSQEMEPVTITGCWPPSGAWATPEDFARIRRRQAEWRARVDKAVTLTFAGVSATYNDEAVTLLTAPRGNTTGWPRYGFYLRSHYPPRKVAPADHVRLPWQALHDSIIDAIRDAGGLPLPVAGLHDADDGLAPLRAEVDAAGDELATAHDELQRLEQQMSETGADGAPVVTGKLLETVNRRYNRITETDIPNVHQRLADARAELDKAQAGSAGTLEDRQLMIVVEGLTRSHDELLRSILPACLADLEITSRRGRTVEGRYRELEWTASLRFTAGEQTYELPIHGRWRSGGNQPRGLDGLIDEHLERMRGGQPWPDQASQSRRRVSRRLSDRLRPGGPPPMVLSCTDPAITAAATRLLLDPAADDAAVAADFDVTVGFVGRVRDVHQGQPGPRTWQQPAPPAEHALYTLAVANGGTVRAGDAADLAQVSRAQIWNLMSRLRAATDLWASHRKRGYQLRPCRCGALDWRLSTIPEPQAPICGSCRRDLGGLHWPAEPYRAYDACPPATGSPHRR